MAGTAPTAQTTFLLPDLISSCPFQVTYHPNGDTIGHASDKWVDDSCPKLTKEQRRKIHITQGGKLGAFAYPYSSDERLRVPADCLNILFHLDDISDEMLKNETEMLADAVMNAMWFPDFYRPTQCEGKEQPQQEIAAAAISRDFWLRFIQGTRPSTHARLLEHMDTFLHAADIEGKNRRNGVILDLDAYIMQRRNVSANRVMFDMIEYALDIELPDFVASDPIVKALNDSANDLVGWENDIASYNVEQARGHTSNLIIVLMHQYGEDLQTAVNRAGDLRNQVVAKFLENKTRVSSWGPKIDQDVAAYIRGLEFCVSGNLHWSFVTGRYFGSHAAQVKETRLVTLLPRGASEAT